MPGNNPVRVSDQDAHTHHHAMLEERVLTGKTALIIGKQGQITVNINELGQYIIGLAKVASAGNLTSCKSYDPTKACSAGIFYKILDTDSIVTAGIVCAGSASPVKATAGKYLCLKAVPALKNDGTDKPYYIPQIPDASGSLVPDDPSGNLAAANANKYWELFTPSQICEGVI